MQTRNVKIYGTGTYVPSATITAEEMDRRLGVADGWSLKATQVRVRRFAADGETASFMGAKAAYAALEAAGLSFADVDCLVATCGTKEQPLPSSGALIQRAMGQEESGVPAFDIDTTCLSFVAGLDMMSYLVDAGRYRRVLLVASEVASAGIDWSDKESAALFGDGAAAVVIGSAEPGERSRIVGASFRTYSQGASYSEVRGGGTAMPASLYRKADASSYLFQMNGPAVFKLAAQLLPGFVDELFAACGGLRMSELRVVVPHQGSAMAMRLMQRRLGISAEQMINITETAGNTVAASIPMALHEAIRSGRLRRGDRALLLGTAAGLTLGGLVLDY
ncbi:beta-ketoacyl-ACP synthase III [Paenibacillus sp. TRM 82003]|nr:beta-ketoacyl-ACP synthase III [Paenibacillus sp. TRM 82003]